MDLSDLSKKKKTYTTGEDDLFPFFFFLSRRNERERETERYARHTHISEILNYVG